MEVKQILRMNEGEGKASYALNSCPQKLTIYLVKPMLEDIIGAICHTKVPETIKFADLGCSSGPNALEQVDQIIHSIHKVCNNLNQQKKPIIQFFLNDLEGNDFNNIFKLLPSFYKKLGNSNKCFIAATPGSFYERLFPDRSLHCVCSSNSLHWLSQVPKGLVTDSGKPLNKGNIYISKDSDPKMHRAYLDQFEKDFTFFLKLRFQELVPKGHLLLTMTSEPDEGYNSKELIGFILHDMVNEGLVKEADLDSFNLPMYAPTSNEVKKVVEQEGSFKILHLETLSRPWNHLYEEDYTKKREISRGEYISKFIRAVFEPILVSRFGESIMDQVFDRYSEKAEECMGMNQGFFNQVVISLVKNDKF